MKYLALMALVAGQLAWADQTICGRVVDVTVDVTPKGETESSIVLLSQSTSVRILNPKASEYPIPTWTATMIVNLETEALKDAGLQFCAEIKGNPEPLAMVGGHLVPERIK